MKRRAVIFDLFGTLIDNMTYGEYRDLLVRMARNLGLPEDDFERLWTDTVDDRFRGRFHSIEDSLVHVCRLYGREVPEGNITAAALARGEFVERALVPRGDALSTLAAVRERKLKVGLISDCTPETPLKWERSPFAPLFDATVFSCLVGTKKPDRRIYEIACERLKVRPEECLYVGDGGSGELTGAAAVGMTPVLISAENFERALGHRSEAKEWRGPVIRSLAEILDYC